MDLTPQEFQDRFLTLRTKERKTPLKDEKKVDAKITPINWVSFGKVNPVED
jgi:hypothetical protein